MVTGSSGANGLINGKIKQNISINHNFLWAILETISFPRIIAPFWCRKKNQWTPLAIIGENTVSVLPSSETGGGGQSGREKRHDESFQAQAEKPLGTNSHQTISKRSSKCWLLIGHKKCFVLLCPIDEQHLLSSFREFVYDGYWLDHSLSGSCTKEMHAVRKLSVWYKLSISKYCLPENYRCFSKNTSLSLQQVFTLASIMPSYILRS